MSNKTTQEVVNALSNFANGMMQSHGNEFIQCMAREHRTLQQSFTGLCLKWLTHLASLKEFEYDGRNEASVKLAKEIMEKVPRANYGLPLI